METKKCGICDKDFQPKRKNQVYCSMPHLVTCFGCEKEFKLKRAYKGRKHYTCGKQECKTKLTKYTVNKKYGVDNVFQNKQVKEKIKETNLERYGAEYPSQNDEIRKKQQDTMIERYNAKTPLESKEIREKITKTNMKRYGVENVSQSKDIQEQIRKTNLERYGVEHVFQSDEVKNKINKTNLERYGTYNPRWDNKEIKEKAEKTNLNKYGHVNPFGSKEIQEKIKESNMVRYGKPWVTQVDEIKDKMKVSFMKNYGVDNPGKSEEVKEKMRNTNLKKYNAESYMQSSEGKERMKSIMLEKYGVENMSHVGIKNYEDYIDLDNFLKETTMNITDIAKYFNLPRRKIRKKIIELGHQKLFKDLCVNSVEETDFENFILNTEQLKNIKYVRNDRSVLGDKELDFYFPDNNLAVEISPTYTHNSKVGWGNKSTGVDQDYHIDKFLGCEKQGIELLTIFDWHDWDKVLTMIEYKLMKSKSIYGRKTEYIEHDRLNNDIFKKLNDWHILNLPMNFKRKNDVSTLIYNNEVVGIALWQDRNDSTAELKRLVFKPGTSVVGGASKLIKNYIKNKNLKKIVTFSDCDLGAGNVYSTLSFKLIEESKPTLNYYNEKEEKHIRYLSLVMQGADRLLKNFPNYKHVGMGEDLPSNVEIVESYGFLPVYDCGYRKWELKIND